MGTQLQYNWVEKEVWGSLRVSKDDMKIQLHMKLPNKNLVFYSICYFKCNI